jgi:hypothetical protein
MQPPKTFLESKWESQQKMASVAPVNILSPSQQSAASMLTGSRLFQAANQSDGRQYVPMMDYDFHRNLTNFGRRVLMSVGRWLAINNPILRAAIEDLTSNIAAMRRLYAGPNAAWGDEMESLLKSNDKYGRVEGWPYTFLTARRTIVSACLTDGETYTLLTETSGGYPQIQMIPAHRIGSPYVPGIIAVKVRLENNQMFIDDKLVEDAISADPESYGTAYTEPVEFFARLIDGVIVNSYSRPIAYRVYSENQADLSNYRDISSRDMFPSFIPQFDGQVRGFPILTSLMWPMQDVHEGRDLERVIQKLAASMGFNIVNETGTVDPSRAIIRTTSANKNSIPNADDEGNLVHQAKQIITGAQIWYTKAGTNQKIEAITADRPSENQQALDDKIVREAIASMGQSVDYFLDAKKSGAAMRVIVARINQEVSKWHELILVPWQTRVDGWRVPKFIKRGDVSFDESWPAWTYQSQRRITADAKYDSDVDIREIENGITTPEIVISRNGGIPEHVRKSRIDCADKLLQDAALLATKYNISITIALGMLQKPMGSITNIFGHADSSNIELQNPNGTMGEKGSSSSTTQEKEPDEEDDFDKESE